jgi:hypothetical protein
MQTNARRTAAARAKREHDLRDPASGHGLALRSVRAQYSRAAGRGAAAGRKIIVIAEPMQKPK